MSWLERAASTPTRMAVCALVAFSGLLGCALAAGELLALAERPDGSTGFDARVTSWAVSTRTGALTSLARWCSDVGSTKVIVPLVAVGAIWLLWRRRWVSAGLLVLAWGGSVGLYNLAKPVVDRPRPPAGIQLQTAAGSSFPSGHATQSLSTFLAVMVVLVATSSRWRLPGWVLVAVLAGAIGWSRVYLGMHWATDVAAGWLIGGLWVTVMVWLARRARHMTTDT